VQDEVGSQPLQRAHRGTVVAVLGVVVVLDDDRAAGIGPPQQRRPPRRRHDHAGRELVRRRDQHGGDVRRQRVDHEPFASTATGTGSRPRRANPPRISSWPGSSTAIRGRGAPAPPAAATSASAIVVNACAAPAHTTSASGPDTVPRTLPR
jgi:hypothetical protein